MKQRNSLELFGRGNEVLRIEGSLVFYKDVNRREHKLPIANIQRVIIVPPGLIHHGALMLATAQGKGGLGTFSRPDIRINFVSKDEIPYAENIQKYILDFQANAGISSTAEPCALDQIAKLKTLLDSGAITEEEFEAKKKQLLGL